MKFFLCAVALVLVSLCGCGPGAPAAQQPRFLANTVVTTDYSATVQQLYVAYFGRPADSGGLANFCAQLAALNAPSDLQSLVSAYRSDPGIKSLIDSFGASAESTALYSGTTTAFVTAIYSNLLNRLPGAEGLAYWTGAIDAGELTKANASLAIAAGAMLNTTTQGQRDAKLINNKVSAATTFTQALQQAPVDGFRGDRAAAQARALLAAISADTDLGTFQATINALVTELAVPARTTIDLLAGEADGRHAPEVSMAGLVVDSAGNSYVAAPNSHVVIKISRTGVVQVIGKLGSFGLADGSGSLVRFYVPSDLAIDKSDNVFVADRDNHAVRKITPAGLVTTVAVGSNTAGAIFRPDHLTVDSTGNTYVTSASGYALKKVGVDGLVSTLAGDWANAGEVDGVGASARFNKVYALGVDGNNTVYVASGSRIRKVSPAGSVTTLVGTVSSDGAMVDGNRDVARLGRVRGMAVDVNGKVFFSEYEGGVIRVAGTDGSVSTLAGAADTRGMRDGVGSAARFNLPDSVALDPSGNAYVLTKRILDNGVGVPVTIDQSHAIRKITAAGAVSTLPGMATSYFAADGVGAAARFLEPAGVVVSPTGNVFLADAVNRTIHQLSATGNATTLAGSALVDDLIDGNGSAARFSYPKGIAADTAGNLYVADAGSSAIRKISPSGSVSTLAGAVTYPRTGLVDGQGAAARFNFPSGIAVDAGGNVFVADTLNHVIRKINPTGVVSTIAGGGASSWGSHDGNGTAARFCGPTGIAVDGNGNLYVSDRGNNSIRKINSQMQVTTIAGSAGQLFECNASPAAYGDGPAAAARFNAPEGVAVDSGGNVYVADSNNDVIRKISPAGWVSTVAGTAGSMGIVLGRAPGMLARPYGVAVNAQGALIVTSAQGVFKIQ